MNPQTTSFMRSLLKIIGTALVAHGATKAADWVNNEDVIGVILTAIGLLASHFSHASDPATLPPKNGGGATSAFLLLAGLLCFTGCTSVVNQPQGKILSVTERSIGFKYGQRPDSQTPEMSFGFFSSAVVIIPTCTNGTVSSPNFANTFDFAQSGITSLGIGENIASGNYQTYSPGGTNSALAVTPK